VDDKIIYFATTNKAKVEVARNHMTKYGYKVEQLFWAIDEPEYTNDSRVIATEKALSAIKIAPGPVICEDGGFFVDALGEQPGVKVHGYLASRNEYGEKGAKKLLREMAPYDERAAHFISVLAYMEKSMAGPVLFEERLDGVITRGVRGQLKPHSWSELHLIFVPSGADRTLAEMPYDEYEKFARSENENFRSLCRYLSSRLGDT
jgi:non-canonical purine NTP pyrophosphatase (RdgB/HAM1 family)